MLQAPSGSIRVSVLQAKCRPNRVLRRNVTELNQGTRIVPCQSLVTVSRPGRPGRAGGPRFAMSSFPMISIADATDKILEITPTNEAVTLPLVSLPGTILAEDVCAQESVPAVPTSIMDGYAVVSSDGPGEYKLCAHARAGDTSELEVKPGTVAYITTGSPVPNGADAVVMIEDTSRSGDLVQIKTKATARQHIREIGSDIEKNEVRLESEQLESLPQRLVSSIRARAIMLQRDFVEASAVSKYRRFLSSLAFCSAWRSLCRSVAHVAFKTQSTSRRPRVLH
jgi:hypothetical protein